MLGLKLNHVSKRGHRTLLSITSISVANHVSMIKKHGNMIAMCTWDIVGLNNALVHILRRAKILTNAAEPFN